MKKTVFILSIAALALGMTSCASADKMAKMADEVTVQCNPSPLVLKGGKVEADLAVNYPKGYFQTKAIAEITPVIVFEGGEVAMEPLMFQGEKVKNNYRVVSKDGGVVNQHVCFTYQCGMIKSHLELRGRASTDNGKKWVTLPTKKIADGCISTETLACRGFYGPKESGYQDVLTFTPEGQVMYKINSSIVRNSEYKNQSVKDFIAAINEVNDNERKTLKGIDIVAYASPDGKEDFNDALSAKRSKTADKAFGKITKKVELGDAQTTVKSVGEDWEGFQEMVNNSNIEDKDLILRVLGMYSDPNVREKEIRNMSSIFQDLKKDILPQLRRARFIANVEYRNYSDAELKELINSNIDILDETALLEAATLCKKDEAKVVYNKAVDKFGSEKAVFALACIALDEHNTAEAKSLVARCDASDADVINLKGVIALREGKLDAAKQYFKAANTADAKKNLGLCALKEGDYATAANLCGNEGCDAAVAQLLNGNVAGALAIVDGNCCCPKASYIRAICLARQGKNTEAKAALDKAVAACDKLAERAKKDLEFAKL